MIEFELAEYLLSLSAVNAIVGTRIFIERAPQTEGKLDPRIVCRQLPVRSTSRMNSETRRSPRLRSA